MARANKLYPLEKRRVSLCPIWKLHVDKTPSRFCQSRGRSKERCVTFIQRIEVLRVDCCLRDSLNRYQETFATIGIRNVVEKKTMHQMPNSHMKSHVTSFCFKSPEFFRSQKLWDAMRIKDFQTGFCLDLLQAEEVKTLRQLFMKQLLGSGRPNQFCCLKSYPKQLECIIKSHKIPKETGFLAANLKAKRRIWLPSLLIGVGTFLDFFNDPTTQILRSWVR